MKPGEVICLESRHNGSRVIFTEARRVEKSLKHPELRDPDFISGRLRTAIESPDFIYEDIGPRGRWVFYKIEYIIDGRRVYTKVVIAMTDEPLEVVTAYRPDYVKERGKTKLLHGKDE